MGLYLIGAVAHDGTFTNKSSNIHVAFLSDHRFFLLPPVHDVCLILADEQVVPCLNEVRCRHKVASHVCNLPRALAYEWSRSSDGHGLVSIILNVLSSWSSEPLPWTFPFPLWIFPETCSSALRSPLLPSRPQRWLFLPCPLGSSCVSLEHTVQSSRHLLVLVVFCQVAKCWPFILLLSPPGVSVPRNERKVQRMCCQFDDSPRSSSASTKKSSWIFDIIVVRFLRPTDLSSSCTASFCPETSATSSASFDALARDHFVFD